MKTETAGLQTSHRIQNTRHETLNKLKTLHFSEKSLVSETVENVLHVIEICFSY